MPYLTKTGKDYIDGGGAPTTPGQLNYMFTTIIRDYWGTHSNYQGINDIIGALEGCKLEFYRRVASFYEQEKIKDNGDVYTN